MRKILTIALMGAVVLLSVSTCNLLIENQNLLSEKSQLELEYGYASEMLGGFLRDPDSAKEQVNKIKQNPIDSV